jgi:hypothetical protein
MHVEDLIRVEAELGYRYEMNEPGVEHYQWICPPCRRALFALAQGQLWQGQRGGVAIGAASAEPPSYANPAIGEGPLGEEDKNNFHA